MFRAVREWNLDNRSYRRKMIPILAAVWEAEPPQPLAEIQVVMLMLPGHSYEPICPSAPLF
jgi:hypothetical protein